VISFLLTLRRMIKAVVKAFKDKEFQVLLSLIVIILLSGTVFYSTVEGFRIIDALYFSVATLTTVGDAHLSPTTDFGKVFTMLYLITGIGIMLGFIVKIAENIRKK